MGGWYHSIGERAWQDVRDFLTKGDRPDKAGSYLIDIVDSVLATGADQLLAVTTSALDVVTVPLPVAEPPFDVLIVCAAWSPRAHPPGTVRILHSTVSGNDTDIVRPASEAVPLFWRFLDIEFGIRQRRPGPTP